MAWWWAGRRAGARWGSGGAVGRSLIIMASSSPTLSLSCVSPSPSLFLYLYMLSLLSSLSGKARSFIFAFGMERRQTVPLKKFKPVEYPKSRLHSLPLPSTKLFLKNRWADPFHACMCALHACRFWEETYSVEEGLCLAQEGTGKRIHHPCPYKELWQGRHSQEILTHTLALPTWSYPGCFHTHL